MEGYKGAAAGAAARAARGAGRGAARGGAARGAGRGAAGRGAAGRGAAGRGAGRGDAKKRGKDKDGPSAEDVAGLPGGAIPETDQGEAPTEEPTARTLIQKPSTSGPPIEINVQVVGDRGVASKGSEKFIQGADIPTGEVSANWILGAFFLVAYSVMMVL